MRRSDWLWIAFVAVVLGGIGWTIAGDPAGLLAGLIAGLPVFRELVGRAREEAAREQAERDRVKAQAERDQVRADLAKIDAETAAKIEQLKAEAAAGSAEAAERWKRVRDAPTEADVREMLDRFGR